MTDAFRCNGCGEYADQEFQFVDVEMDTSVCQYHDVTIDDMPTDAFGLLPDSVDSKQRGDLCVGCGLRALDALLDVFGGEDSDV